MLCALRSLQQLSEAAEMYDKAGQVERAASIYIQVGVRDRHCGRNGTFRGEAVDAWVQREVHSVRQDWVDQKHQCCRCRDVRCRMIDDRQYLAGTQLICNHSSQLLAFSSGLISPRCGGGPSLKPSCALQAKNFAAAAPLMAKVSSAKLQLQFAKAKEAEGRWVGSCVSGYGGVHTTSTRWPSQSA
jgi:hypothetical protein